tara:strand:+ start:706 stop:1038 length:333 start_codon:yes stop_codon:yes gene_type:complete
MTIDSNDTLTGSLILEDNIPLPKDRRLGTGEKLPLDLREAMEQMSVGQSFFLPTNLDDQKSKIGAIRASIARYANRADSPIDGDMVFSVRRENDPFRLGVRVFRMDDRVD